MKINLIEYFEGTVQVYPDKIALVDENGKFTFGQLKKRAQNIAKSLISNHASIRQPVAVYLSKSNDAVASFLGIMYSGNIYAPLDVKNPINRIQSILDVLKPSCILVNNNSIDQIKNIDLGIRIINIDVLELSESSDVDQYKLCIDTDPAYILHTSGSTGVPKGVVISHKAIIDFIHWVIKTFNITSQERIGNQAPFVFDNSTLDIYLMVFTGATLYLPPDQFYIFPQKTIDYLKVNDINFIFWVPSALVHVANTGVLKHNYLPNLKKVLFCGEIMPSKHLNIWRRSLNKTTLFANLYGPTEITDLCTYHIIDKNYKNSEQLPIGMPCRNTDILILNEKNEICNAHEHGELCVRGSSLSNGYWCNSAKTSNTFVQNPLNQSYPELIYRTGDIVYKSEDGNIYFVGRKDFQIKHLGYRIEIGEIEHIILSNFDSISICVIYDEARKEIVLFYQSKNEIKVFDFRIKLGGLLNKYMIPTRYIKLNQLPKNASGKIDRKYLKNYMSEI